jgi:hypothetical protein
VVGNNDLARAPLPSQSSTLLPSLVRKRFETTRRWSQLKILKFGDEGHFLLLPPFGAQSRNEKKLVLDLFFAKNDQNTPHRLK